MADRQTKVSLVAQVSGYVAGMQQAAASTRDVGDAAAKLANQRQAFADVGRASMAMGAVAAAAVGLAIAKYAEFDQAMSNVQAATQETTENMGLLREAALDAGARTVYSATEAANAIEELGKNGLTTADILSGGLDAALSIAASGQVEVGRAAEIAALSMKQFNLNGRDLPHIADLLAAGAGKAAGDVEDMAQALAQGGLVANSTGLSIEETTGILAAFADNALIGSDAGTSLKTMLQRLTPTSKEAKDEMNRLGISAYDAKGHFIGAAAFAGNLRDAMRTLTPEQRNASEAIIFGSDAVRAANVLYDEGATGIQKYIDQTNDSGYAAKVAADRLNNLAGDVEQLGGSLDTALIRTGSGANQVLRDLVQAGTFLVNTIGDMPQPALDAGLAIGGVSASILLAGGAALVAIPRLAQVKVGMGELGLTAKGTATTVGLAGGAISAATLIIGAFLSTEAQKAQNVDTFADSLDKATGKVTDYTRELVRNRLESEGVYAAAKEAGISLDLVTKAATGNKAAFEEVNREASEYYDSQKTNLPNLINASSNYDKLTDSVRHTSDDLGKAKDSWNNLNEAGDDAADTTEDNTAALAELSGSAQDATTDIGALADAIKGFGSAQLDVNAASREFEKAVDDLSDSIEKNGTTLDRGTEAGRANDSALDDLAKSTLDLAAATVTQTGKQDDANAVIADGRQRLIDMLGQFGIVGQEAETYADKLGLIPGNVGTVVEINTTPAQRALDAFIAYNSTRRIGVHIDGIQGYSGAGGITRATGGILPGAPSSRDNMTIHAASGEFITRASQTAIPANRAALEYMNSGGVIYGYATGGVVGGQPQYASAGAGQQGPRVAIANFTVTNPKQLTTQGSTVAGLRHLDMELSL